MAIFIFWFLIFIVFYAYFGYGLLLFLLVKIKRLFSKQKSYAKDYIPEVTFVTAAYNEEDWIEEKIENCLNFDYPKDKITFFFVTDGSSDRTPDIIQNYNYPDGVQWKLLHKPERKGKIAAVKRIMPMIKTPITIFTDANTDVNRDAIKMMVRHFHDDHVGAVAGEKKVKIDGKASAKAGEGFYWKYESFLKRLDSEFHTVVGAAGELFAIRTSLYKPVPQNAIVEDFVMTMGIAAEGNKVVYEPQAYAEEGQSASIAEELKRKIRIAAGGIQSIIWLAPLLNPFKHGWLTFQYVSHRVLRWTLAPLALPIIFALNIWLAQNVGGIYTYILYAQIAFYAAAILGWLLEKKSIKIKALFIPFYFCMMNYAMFKGFFRFLKGNQSVIWEKAKRA